MRWLTIALLTFTFTAQAEEVYRDNTVRFTLIDEGTIRLEYAPDGKFVDNRSFVAVIREYGNLTKPQRVVARWSSRPASSNSPIKRMVLR